MRLMPIDLTVVVELGLDFAPPLPLLLPLLLPCFRIDFMVLYPLSINRFKDNAVGAVIFGCIALAIKKRALKDSFTPECCDSPFADSLVHHRFVSVYRHFQSVCSAKMQIVSFQYALDTPRFSKCLKRRSSGIGSCANAKHKLTLAVKPKK